MRKDYRVRVRLGNLHHPMVVARLRLLYNRPTNQSVGANFVTTLIVLFNLKADVDPADYERWAATTDLPTVRGLDSCAGFDVYRASGLLGSDVPAPYQYIEVIAVDDMQRFGEEIATDTMRQVASEFQSFADAPMFILTERLDA